MISLGGDFGLGLGKVQQLGVLLGVDDVGVGESELLGPKQDVVSACTRRRA